jgi:hypothetical protein
MLDTLSITAGPERYSAFSSQTFQLFMIFIKVTVAVEQLI